MGFFDTFTDTAPEGGVFIDKDEKAELKDREAVLTINAIKSEENPFNGNERYVLSVEVDGKDRKLTFDLGTGVDSRDRMLAALDKYLEDPIAQKPRVTLAKIGRAWVLKAAS